MLFFFVFFYRSFFLLLDINAKRRCNLHLTHDIWKGMTCLDIEAFGAKGGDSTASGQAGGKGARLGLLV